jgi:multidrug efflux pump subunit AcrA (membrane-fusion protein)
MATETLATSGAIEGQTEATLGADAQGTLVRLDVDENDVVRKGRLLAIVQDRSASNAIDQSEAALRSARAKLAETLSGASAEERRGAAARLGVSTEGAIRAGEAVDDARFARSQADAQLSAARIARARAVTQRDAAQAKSDLANLRLRRAQTLVKEGALAGARLDEARADATTADSALKDAEEAILGAQADIERCEFAAQRAVIGSEQAESAFRSSKSARAADLAEYDRLRSLPRPETLRVAREAVREAETAARNARAFLNNSEIRAPFDGTVVKVLCRPGGSIGASGLLRLVETSRLEAKVQIDESYLDRLAVGQRAYLTTPANPSLSIDAHISRLSTGVDSSQGAVEATIVPDKPNPGLRPGGTIDATVVLSSGVRRLLIPTSSVRRRGDETVTFSVKNGRAIAIPIHVGRSSGDSVAVLDGLQEGEQIVRDAVGMENGKRVRL